MKRNIKDPVQKFGGRPLPGIIMLILIPVLLVGSGAAWYWSSDEGGFREVDNLASVKCLGCLGLDPVVPGFKEFWTVYPEDNVNAGQEVTHPDITHQVLDSDEYEIFILFFWTQGCVPCAEQWEEMKEKDIASGPEDGGREGPRYDKLRMICFDAAKDTSIYRTYTPKGTETGVPMTTFVFKAPEGGMHWWSHYGKMELDDVVEMIEGTFEYIEALKLAKDYDDISSVDDHH
jgi:hypothetical protein